ncbi:NUDIX hydrolase [Parapedobacter lycopersici]|uniref:NUDIX hydrolase n=1 Tax=Parapedobacter lycopersici TaxID=1864939 RepID=UPI00214D8197|nr:NUDIX hydrolase [Parapedobacter lycopersici]
MHWKTLSSEYLVRAPWAVLRKDRCQMPNGHIVPEYYVLEYPNWVNMVALTADNQFILIKQYRHGVQQEVLEIPGGVIDPGEDAPNAAVREMLEETGYRFAHIEPLSDLFPNPATSTNKTTSYLLTGGVKVQEQALDDQEEIDVVLASPEEVKQLLQENRFGQALHTAALFYGLLRLGLMR